MNNNKKIQRLIDEHTDILLNNFDDFDVIEPDDPDLQRMEEIMEEIKKLEEDES